jgi:hypothetical protein
MMISDGSRSFDLYIYFQGNRWAFVFSFKDDVLFLSEIAGGGIGLQNLLTRVPLGPFHRWLFDRAGLSGLQIRPCLAPGIIERFQRCLLELVYYEACVRRLRVREGDEGCEMACVYA